MGGMLEFYDFTIYGLFSVYFAESFFPSHNQFLSIIASYVIFIIGYIARPIGGIIFSHIGDEIGRKIVLILTMIIMGLASLGIGLLPGYAKIGIWAPILLLTFRLVQGLALGGELPSMIVYVTESMPDKRGYAIGGVLSGTDAGLLLGALANLVIVHTLTHQQIQSFGWRIPFILGGLLCFVSYQIRKKLHETTAFVKNDAKPKFPFIDVLKNYPLQVILGAGIAGVMGAFVMLSIIFMPTFLVQIAKINRPDLSSILLISTVVTVVSAYLMGIIANKFNQAQVTKYTLIIAIPLSLISYIMISHQYCLVLALCILTMLQGFFATLAPLMISYIFPTHIRLTGVALAYNMGHTIFGGMAPIIVTAAISATGLIYMVPLGYILAVVIIGLISLNIMRKGKQY
jgi:MFS family permease